MSQTDKPIVEWSLKTMPKRTSDESLTESERERLVGFVRDQGYSVLRAAQLLNVCSYAPISRALAGLPLRRPTLIAIRLAMHQRGLI